MAGAPAVWNAVLDAAADWDGEIPGRDRVRIVVAGAPPPSKTIARVEAELGWEFNQIYGLTETAPLLTINRPRAEFDALEPEERAKKLSRAGVPALGIRLQISESGEVLAQGNVVLAGYWENPDASAEALDGGWFHTGDGGTIDDGGYLTISDRKKDVIITGGENVSSIEVEDVVFSHPAVAEVAVIGVPDDKWGEMVTAHRRRRRGRAGHRGGDHRPLPRQDRRATRSPSGSSSATSSPAPPPARSRSSSSASRSGTVRSARSTEPRAGTPRVRRAQRPPVPPDLLHGVPRRVRPLERGPLRGRPSLEVDMDSGTRSASCARPCASPGRRWPLSVARRGSPPPSPSLRPRTRRSPRPQAAAAADGREPHRGPLGPADRRPGQRRRRAGRLGDRPRRVPGRPGRRPRPRSRSPPRPRPPPPRPPPTSRWPATRSSPSPGAATCRAAPIPGPPP